MNHITIKFTPGMEARIAAGLKTATTCDEKKGEIGDTFTVLGGTYMILDIVDLSLMTVRDHFYRAEGFTSPKKFETFWRSMFGGFPEMKPHYIHFFARLP